MDRSSIEGKEVLGNEFNSVFLSFFRYDVTHICSLSFLYMHDVIHICSLCSSTCMTSYTYVHFRSLGIFQYVFLGQHHWNIPEGLFHDLSDFLQSVDV